MENSPSSLSAHWRLNKWLFSLKSFLKEFLGFYVLIQGKIRGSMGCSDHALVKFMIFEVCAKVFRQRYGSGPEGLKIVVGEL